MKKCFFISLSFLIILVCCCTNKVNATTTDNVDTNLIVDAKSGCLIESKTNTIIYSKNENERLAPASMTKIMTMLLVMEKIDNKEISYNDVVTTPKIASDLGGSQIYLSEGEKMSVNDLLKSMCIASANDAALSLAVYVAGNEAGFVQMMNNKVQELGLNNTHFVNPYGFDNDNHYSSSYDMACIANYLITNHPDILNYTSVYEDYVREDTEKRFWLVNTNKLVKFLEGCDGLKTGWTNNSGYCLTATISKNNERFIAVTMGNSSPSIRNSEVTSLLQYGINNYETKTILSKDQIIKEINDVSITPKHIVLKPNKDVIIIKKKNEQLKNIELSSSIDLDNKSYVDVYYDNKLYSRVYLETNVNVKKTSIWDLFLEIIKQLFLAS